MIWSGDRVPITANNDDAAVLLLLWSIAMLRRVLSIATEYINPAKTINTVKVWMAQQQTQISTKG